VLGAGLAGCAGSGAATPAPPTTWAPALTVSATADEAAAARAVAALARTADVVYLGEQHDNPADHAHQVAIAEAVVALGRRPALAFEMLDEGQQAAVDSALAEVRTEEDVAERLGWRARGWPDFSMYWPLFALAARERLPVIALDLDPAVARRLARDGPSALGARATALTSLLPPDAEREATIARTIRESHCGLLPEARVPSMVQAWHARNVTMARHLAAALSRGQPVIVIVGRGHQDAGGLPAQFAALRPGLRQLVVSFREVRPTDPPASVPAGIDVVWFTPAVERGDPCAPIRRAPRAC